MAQNKFLGITNQELLTELEQRLVNFDQSDLEKLLGLLSKKEEQVLQIIQEIDPQTHHWIQEKTSQLEQEKTDKEIERGKN